MSHSRCGYPRRNSSPEQDTKNEPDSSTDGKNAVIARTLQARLALYQSATTRESSIVLLQQHAPLSVESQSVNDDPSGNALVSLETPGFPMSASVARALAVPITPGSVKRKRDILLAKELQDSYYYRHHDYESPRSGMQELSGGLAQRNRPPWNVVLPPLGIERGCPVQDMVATTNNKKEDTPTRKLQRKWPPLFQTNRGADIEKQYNVAAMQQTPEVAAVRQVKVLRSHFERSNEDGSTGAGPPLGLIVAQELYRSLVLAGKPTPETFAIGSGDVISVSPSATPRSVSVSVSVSASSLSLHGGSSSSSSSSSNSTTTAWHQENATRASVLPEVLRTASTSFQRGASSRESVPTTVQSDEDGPPSDTLQQEHGSIPPEPAVEVLCPDEDTPIQDLLPVQDHFADIVLPSGQKLPPPKGRQKHRRTNYRIRYEGPTLLRLEDVYGNLLEIPEVDERFTVAEPRDSMVLMPPRTWDRSHRAAAKRGKRTDLSGKGGMDLAPVRPGRRHFDSDCDSFGSNGPRDANSRCCSTNEHCEHCWEQQLKSGAVPGSSRIQWINRPDVWITPLKSFDAKCRWKVKRVWDVEDVDDEEEEYSVDHEDLMETIKSLLGVPEQFGQTSEEWDVKIDSDSPWEVDGTKDSPPWYVKRVYDIDGEIESSNGDDEEEIRLSNGGMAMAMKEIPEEYKSHNEEKLGGPYEGSRESDRLAETNVSVQRLESTTAMISPSKKSRHSVRAFARPDDWVSPVDGVSTRKKNYVIKRKWSVEAKDTSLEGSNVLHCQLTALNLNEDDSSSQLVVEEETKSNDPSTLDSNESKTAAAKKRYRRRSTTDIPDKNGTVIFRPKEAVPTGKNDHSNNCTDKRVRSCALSVANEDPKSASGKPQRRNSVATLGGPSVTPKKPIKMWWHK